MYLLIDGDVLLWKAGKSMESSVHQKWADDGSGYELPPVSHTLTALKEQVKGILRPFETGEYGYHLDGYDIYLTSTDRSNFRYQLPVPEGAKKYKENRKKIKKPVYFEEMRDYLINYHAARVIYDQEADDALGIEQGNMRETFGIEHEIESSICSIDKDMLNIVGWNYNFDKKELKYITEEEADYHFYWQMLVGDTADNVSGVKGIGPKKATAALSGLSKSEMIEKVLEFYKYDLENFFYNGDLLWIRRQENDSFMNAKDRNELVEHVKLLKEKSFESQVQG